MYQSGFRFVRFFLLTLCLGFLSACGLPGPGSGIDPQDSDDENDTNQYEDVLHIRIQTNDAMRTSWQGDLFNLITPQKAWALRGLEEINSLSTNSISVIRLDEEFNEHSIPEHFAIKKSRSGIGYDILFQEALEKQLNRVVRVTLPNDEVMYGPLYKAISGDNIVVVSVASHYVIKKLYDNITTREELEDLLSCDGVNTNCSHQSRVKLEHIINLIELVHEYDLEITPEMTVAAALDFFDGTLTLRTMVETGIQEILREKSPITHGTSRAFRTTDGYDPEQLNRALNYNSTVFALELLTVEPESDTRRVGIGASTSRIIPMNTATPRNSLPIYPRLGQTSNFFQNRTDSLSFDIPFTRSLMTYTRSNVFSVANSDIFQSLAAASIDTYLSTEGNLMAGSVLEQTIDSSSIGWQSNPIYKQLYRVNQYEPNLDPDRPYYQTTEYPDSAPWLVSASAMKGENYNIVGVGNATERAELLEDRYVFSWEIHAEETPTEFSTTVMEGKSYGVLSYGLKMYSSNVVSAVPAIELTAATTQWDAATSRQFNVTQPSTHYRTRSLTRNNQHLVTSLTTLPASTATHIYSAVPTIEDDNDPQTANGTVAPNKGLLSVDGGLRPITGHASSNGSHFALVLNKPGSGAMHREFIVGTQLDGGPGAFSQVRYQLQGNTMELLYDETRLTNLNQSTLELTNTNNGCLASLTISSLSVSQDIFENTVGAPTATTQNTTSSATCSITGSEISITFASVLGQSLTLTGFFSKTEDDAETSNLINLLWLQGSNVGLVFATRDQELEPGFPDQLIID